ncbi:MAG: hypothetical protein ACOCWO_01255 [Candidatus Muiribacteriaceae bacterium]
MIKLEDMLEYILKKRISLTFIFIFVSGAVLRLIKACQYSEFWLNWDELTTVAWNFRYSTVTDLLSYLFRWDCHPPLFTLTARVFVYSGIPAIISVKIMSVVISLLIIPVVYFFMRSMGAERKTALWGMAFAAFNPMLVYQSVRVFPYPLFLLLIMISHIMYLSVIRKVTFLRMFFYTISLTLLLYSHFFAGFIIAGHVIDLVRKKGIKDKRIYCFLISFLSFLPVLILSRNSPLNPDFYEVAVRQSIFWIRKTDVFSLLNITFSWMVEKTEVAVFDWDMMPVFIIFMIIYVFLKAVSYKNRSVIFDLLYLPFLMLVLTGLFYSMIFDQGLIEKTHLIFLLLPMILAFSLSVRGLRYAFLLFCIITVLVNIRVSERSDFQLIFEDLIKEHNDRIYVYPEYYEMEVNHHVKENAARVIALKDLRTLEDIPEDSDLYLFITDIGDDTAIGREFDEKLRYLEKLFRGRIRTKYIISEKSVLYRIERTASENGFSNITMDRLQSPDDILAGIFNIARTLSVSAACFFLIIEITGMILKVRTFSTENH